MKEVPGSAPIDELDLVDAVARIRAHTSELADLVGLPSRRIEEALAEAIETANRLPPLWLPRPLLPGSPEPEPLPVEILPDGIRRHVESVARATQTDTGVGLLLALAVVSAAVGGTVHTRVDDRGWIEPPNIYTIPILPTGERKSAVFAHYVNVLLAWEQDRGREVGPLYRSALDAVEAAKGAHARALREGGKDIEDARIRLDAARAAVPHLPRLVASDITSEALVRLLAENRGRAAIFAPEGDPLRIADGRYSDGAARLDELKCAWSGEPLRVDRIGRQALHVPRPALTLALTMQPGVLNTLSNRCSFRAEGFLARVLWLRPPSKLGDRLTGSDVPPLDVAAADRFASLVRCLLGTPLDEDEDRQIVPRTLALSEAAQSAVYDFEAEIEVGLGPGGGLEAIGDWAAKAAGQAVRIASLLELAERADAGMALYEPLSGRALEGAVQLVRALTTHACAVLEDMSLDSSSRLASYVLHRAAKLSPGSTLRDLFEATKGKAQINNMEDLDKVVGSLVERSCVRLRSVGRGRPGRPPSPVVEVHPSIRTNRTNLYFANTANGNGGMKGVRSEEPDATAAPQQQ